MIYWATKLQMTPKFENWHYSVDSELSTFFRCVWKLDSYVKPRLHFGHSYRRFCGPFKWLALKCSSRFHLVAYFWEHFEHTWGSSALSVCLLRIWRFRWQDCLIKGLSTVFTNIKPVICMGSNMSISVGLLFECFVTFCIPMVSLPDESRCASRDPHDWQRNDDNVHAVHWPLWPAAMVNVYPDDLYRKLSAATFPVQIARLVAFPAFVLHGCPALKLKSRAMLKK